MTEQADAGGDRMTADDRGANLPSEERATYQSLRARGFSHEVALADALDGVTVDSIREAAKRGTLKAPSDDRGATVPEAHIDAVARIVDAYPEALDDLLTTSDPAVLDALAWAVTRTPEGRDKVLAALVETGTLTEDSLPASQEWDSLDAVLRGDAGRMVGYRRLVTEWTEVGPLGSQRDSEEKPTGSPRAVAHLTHPAVPQSWCGQDGPASNDIADVICPSCLRALIRHLTRNEDAKAQPAVPPLQPDPDLITHTEGARHAERAKAAARAALGATRADPQGLAAPIKSLSALADEWEHCIPCECGHGLDEHNGLGCYARLSYEPLVTCPCALTDDRHHGQLAAAILRRLVTEWTEVKP